MNLGIKLCKLQCFSSPAKVLTESKGFGGGSRTSWVQAGVTNLQKAGYDSANIFDKAVMPPSSVTHQVGTCRPDFMLPEVRLAVLLPGNLVASSGFSRAQDLLSHCDWCYER